MQMNKQRIGSLLFIGGILLLIYAVFIKTTSVSYITSGPFGGYSAGSVNNFGLMQERLIEIILGLVATVVGSFLLHTGNKELRAKISKSAVSDFDGVLDLHSDAYRLYLTKKYDIEKNVTLNKFICVDKSFDDLESALHFAHQKNSSKNKIIIKAFATYANFALKGFSIVINGQLQQPILRYGEEMEFSCEGGSSAQVYAIIESKIEMLSAVIDEINVTFQNDGRAFIRIEQDKFKGPKLTQVVNF
jgi:hypothetical protein